MSTTNIEWACVPGFPGYRVGSDGSIWTAWVHNGHQPRRLSCDWKRMKPSPDHDGYPTVGLHRNGKATRRKLHVWILLSFRGPRPYPIAQGCHDNGVRTDCRLDNLRWDTPKSNQGDRLKHGTEPRGTKSGKARVTEQQVFEIRAALAAGARKRDVAARIGVSPSTISAIARGQNWAWLQPA
jgi:hypothetical protein